MKLGDWLIQARRYLQLLPDEPTSIFNYLIGVSINQPSSFVLSHPEYELPPEEILRLDSNFARLLNGEPLPYIIGKQDFYGFEMLVSPHVLIPRPETELIVENALHFLNAKHGKPLVADIGTGSGCISVAIAKNMRSASIFAVDKSFRALQIARKNIIFHKLEEQVRFIQSDLLAGIVIQFDCICANLPYIPSKILENLYVKNYEPISALDGGNDGLRLIEPFLVQARSRLKPDGLILVEIESTTSKHAIELANVSFPLASIKILNDLAGLPRLMRIQLVNENL